MGSGKACGHAKVKLNVGHFACVIQNVGVTAAWNIVHIHYTRCHKPKSGTSFYNFPHHPAPRTRTSCFVLELLRLADEVTMGS